MLDGDWLRWSAAAGVFLACTAVQAQVAPTIPTPSELGERRPPIVTDPSQLPAPPRDPPRRLRPPEADVRLDIRGYTVAPDAPQALRLELARLTAPFVGPGKTFADMADAAAEITRFLQRDLGYYLGYAYVPEQEPVDGTIRIEVLEGRLDQVELRWRDDLPVDRAVVEAYLAQLRSGSVLQVRDVERVVFLVNDLRGLAAEFEVKAGRTPGTASLVVTPRPLPLLAWRAELDNANARTLGRARVNGTVYRYSPFGRGDSASASLVLAQRLRFALANYTTPVGASGLRLGLSGSALQYEVDPKTFPVGIEGHASTLSAFALHPVVRSRNLNLFAIGTLDAKSYVDTNGGVETEKDVTGISFGLTGDVRDTLLGGGINSLDVQLGVGEVRFGVRPAVDAPDRRFTKLTARGVRLQNLWPGVLQGLVSVRAQKAWNNLDVTEQFRAGGPDGVRAFPAGEGAGDNGALLSLELRALVPAGWLGGVGGLSYAALFADWATVHLRNDPTDPTVDNRRTYGGVGVGLTWVGPDGWDLRATLARPTVNDPADQDDRPSVRLFVQIGKQF